MFKPMPFILVLVLCLLNFATGGLVFGSVPEVQPVEFFCLGAVCLVAGYLVGVGQEREDARFRGRRETRVVLPDFCVGCANDIDSSVCQCGTLASEHQGHGILMGHLMTPIGCSCMANSVIEAEYNLTPGAAEGPLLDLLQVQEAILQRLRARLYDERDARGET